VRCSNKAAGQKVEVCPFSTLATVCIVTRELVAPQAFKPVVLQAFFSNLHFRAVSPPLLCWAKGRSCFCLPERIFIGKCGF
jgi:hypothetical protein